MVAQQENPNWDMGVIVADLVIVAA